MNPRSKELCVKMECQSCQGLDRHGQVRKDIAKWPQQIKH